MGNALTTPPAENPQSSLESNSERQQQQLFQGHGQTVGNHSPLQDREAIIKRFEELALLDHLERPVENLEDSVTESKIVSLKEKTESASMTEKLEQLGVPTKEDFVVTADKGHVAESDLQHVGDFKLQMAQNIHIITEAIFSCSLQPQETSLKTMIISNPLLYKNGVTLYLESLNDDLKAEASNLLVKQ